MACKGTQLRHSVPETIHKVPPELSEGQIKYFSLPNQLLRRDTCMKRSKALNELHWIRLEHVPDPVFSDIPIFPDIQPFPDPSLPDIQPFLISQTFLIHPFLISSLSLIFHLFPSQLPWQLQPFPGCCPWRGAADPVEVSSPPTKPLGCLSQKAKPWSSL